MAKNVLRQIASFAEKKHNEHCGITKNFRETLIFFIFSGFIFSDNMYLPL